MNRRHFSKQGMLLGMGAWTAASVHGPGAEGERSGQTYREAPRDLPVREFDVVVAGGGTAGVIAALAAARQGAQTILIERRGYTGGTATEGGTGIHSFYNLWKPFPGVKKRKVVRGIPEELIDRLVKIGGSSGYPEQTGRSDYDSVATCVDTELYKLVTMEMLAESGVFLAVNTLVTGAIRQGDRLEGVLTESVNGREAIYAKAFIDCTAFGDLCAFGGAQFTTPNDYPVVNSMGLGNVSIDQYFDFFKKANAVGDYAEGVRSGEENRIIRLGGSFAKASPEFGAEAAKIGMSSVTTTVHDNYLMFIKLNLTLPEGGSTLNRDSLAAAELELRRRMYQGMLLFRKYVPGCEKAFIARTSPSVCIRRGRLIQCDYDMTHEDVVEARHFDDDVFTYGFHDSAPRIQIKNGGAYGLPYRALCVAGIENLWAAGMLITSDHRAHMSTRNTVCCMGQGQAAGTAAALCAAKRCGARELKYPTLREALEKGGVYFEA